MIALDPFSAKDLRNLFEERRCKRSSFSSFESKVKNGTSGMEWFDDFVFEVAGEDEPTVGVKRFNIRS